MKRSLVALAALFVVLTVAAGAAPATAAPRDRVVSGQGVAQPPGRSLPFEFEFEARGTPKQATGRVRFPSVLTPSLVGDVTCLAVEGNRAAISGKLRQSTVNGRYFLIVVEDNGPAQTPPLDAILVRAAPDPIRCARALDESVWPIDEGNIRVR